MKTANKYEYYKVIQQNWGNGWDDVDFNPVNSNGCFYTKEDRELFKHNLKQYRENQTAPVRTVFRKELKTVNNTFKA